MRKITQESIKAFNENRSFSKSNMAVTIENTHRSFYTVNLFLHGNKIATKMTYGHPTLYISNCGWESYTTKERLNALLEIEDMYICQRDYQWYFINKKHTRDGARYFAIRMYSYTSQHEFMYYNVMKLSEMMDRHSTFETAEAAIKSANQMQKSTDLEMYNAYDIIKKLK